MLRFQRIGLREEYVQGENEAALILVGDQGSAGRRHY